MNWGRWPERPPKEIFNEDDQREAPSDHPSTPRTREEDDKRLESSGGGERGGDQGADPGADGTPRKDHEVATGHTAECTCPDKFCFTTPDGECVSEGLCMHSPNYNEEFYEEDFRQQNELGLL